MNNEEQIISMLINLTNKVDRLESDVTELKVNQAELKAGQSEIIHEVKAIREQTQDLVEFKAETRINLSKMDKKLDGMLRVTKDNKYDIAELQSR